MFGISSNMRIFLCREPVDMRKSYDGLANLVEHYFHENVLGGSFFLFMNSQRNRLKILFFDSGGLCLFCKRLERGRFVSYPFCQLPILRTDLMFTKLLYFFTSFAVRTTPFRCTTFTK